jgi:hypothetical protein
MCKLKSFQVFYPEYNIESILGISTTIQSNLRKSKIHNLRESHDQNQKNLLNSKKDLTNIDPLKDN